MPDNRPALTIGNFDGIHLGHRKLLDQLLIISHNHRIPSILITYDHHPRNTLLNAEPLRVLTPECHKEHLLSEIGVDRIVTIHFDRTLAQMTASIFLKDIIKTRFDPQYIVVGYDSHFGHQREGTYDFLRHHEQQYDYRLIRIDPVCYQEMPVSSTRIRSLLIDGDLQTANALLGRYYRLYGKVVKGKGIGMELGFPTANLALDDPNQLLPKVGVYLSIVKVRNKRFFGLTNIGFSPTVKPQDYIEAETYIMDFNAQICGADITIDLVQYLRPEIRFASRAELLQAMKRDLSLAKERIKHVPLD